MLQATRKETPEASHRIVDQYVEDLDAADPLQSIRQAPDLFSCPGRPSRNLQTTVVRSRVMTTSCFMRLDGEKFPSGAIGNSRELFSEDLRDGQSLEIRPRSSTTTRSIRSRNVWLITCVIMNVVRPRLNSRSALRSVLALPHRLPMWLHQNKYRRIAKNARASEILRF